MGLAIKPASRVRQIQRIHLDKRYDVGSISREVRSDTRTRLSTYIWSRNIGRHHGEHGVPVHAAGRFKNRGGSWRRGKPVQAKRISHCFGILHRHRCESDDPWRPRRPTWRRADRIVRSLLALGMALVSLIAAVAAFWGPSLGVEQLSSLRK